jgi:hypothetical protein
MQLPNESGRDPDTHVEQAVDVLTIRQPGTELRVHVSAVLSKYPAEQVVHLTEVLRISQFWRDV